MDRTEAIDRWRRLAEGDDAPEVLEWLRERAAAIVAADALPAAQRRDALVRAAGLAYRADRLRGLAEVINLLLAFEIIGSDGRPRGPTRGEQMRQLINAARDSGLVDHDVSDIELRKRIERLIARKV